MSKRNFKGQVDRWMWVCAAAVGCACGVVSVASADTVLLTAARDNTLYEDATGQISNGQGDSIFAGVTGVLTKRRALAYFDCSSIPAGSTITGAELTLTLIRSVRASTHPVAAHKVLANWGEGASMTMGSPGQGAQAQAGDATWIHRFYSTTNWTTAGGDFVTAASATTNVAQATGAYTRGSTPSLVADVQLFVNNAASNFGWIMVGNEAAAPTAKEFASSEYFDTDARPMLLVTFTPPCALAADIDDSGTVDVVDLFLFLDLWFAQNGQSGANLASDYDQSGTVDVVDLFDFLDDWFLTNGQSC